MLLIPLMSKRAIPMLCRSYSRCPIFHDTIIEKCVTKRTKVHPAVRGSRTGVIV